MSWWEILLQYNSQESVLIYSYLDIQDTVKEITHQSKSKGM